MVDRLLKKHSVWKRFSLSLLLFPLFLATTLAQVTQGELVGEVRDAAGDPRVIQFGLKLNF